MGWGDGARVRATNPPTPLVRGAFSRRRSDGNGLRNDTEMKIIIFPVKCDKFTGLFDKFLKNTVLVNHYNHTGYHSNLSALH